MERRKKYSLPRYLECVCTVQYCPKIKKNERVVTIKIDTTYDIVKCLESPDSDVVDFQIDVVVEPGLDP